MSGRHPPIPPPAADPRTTAPRPTRFDRRTLLRASAAGAFATATGGLAAACGSAAGQGPGKVAIHGDNPAWEAPLKAAGQALQSTAGLQLVPEVIPSLESFEQVVKSSLRTQKTPDLLKYWSGYRLRDLARTGGIEDLSKQWQDAESRGWVEPSLREAFTYDGRVYGLPMNLAYWVIFYNPEVFAEHRLEKPETWDDFLTACTRLKENGITPLHGTTAGRWPAFIWFQEILSRQDPQFYDDLMNGRERYTDPRAQRALRTIAGFFDKDWFTSMDVDHNNAAAAVVHGDVGMVACGTWLGAVFAGAGAKPGKTVDAFVLPMADPAARPCVIFESSAFVATVKGPDKDEALKAAGGWLHPEVATAFAHGLSDGSPNPTVEPANVVIDGVARRSKDLWLLNRFWEQGPPELVESTVDDLAGMLIDPHSYRGGLRTMQERADEAWKVWREAEKS
ncbi:ABC transporter substrate-binding protein [Streptomyces sp. 184]|uniref:ABC transporter substrate-binding protein n=1 Tax=Streptomyces sp. 184 TaxID=1827526 RepID=UPI003891BC69